MTEMVFGAAPARPSEPILTRWWRTVDRWTVGAVLALIVIGLVVGMAASAPLADKLNLPTFYFVARQAGFAVVALAVMVGISMQDPRTVRRLAVMGFCASFLVILALPAIGTDFGKGAVRWISLGGMSVQPSEFLKPALIVLVAFLLSEGGRRLSVPDESLKRRHGPSLRVGWSASGTRGITARVFLKAGLRADQKSGDTEK